MKHNLVNFSEIEKSLKTGDIVLFHGNTFVEELIEDLELSEWSHVAMIVKAKDINVDAEDELLLWESSPISTYIDQFSHKEKSGPHLIYLKELLGTLTKLSKKRYFAVRHLKAEETFKIYKNLEKYIKEKDVQPIGFPKDLNLFSELIEGRFLNIQCKKDTYFCSELIAETFINMGLLPCDCPVNRYDPKDFSSQGHIVLNDAFLEKEVFINYDI